MNVATELAGMLLAHPYLGLAVAVLVEGPSATIVAGTLVAVGVLLWWPALLLAVLGDCVADSLWFVLGRAGRPVPGTLRARVLARVGITPDRWEAVQQRCRNRLPLLIGGAKLADVAAVPTFAALGATGVPYRRFIGWIGAATSVKSAALLTLGCLLAHDLLPAGTSPATALLAGTGLSIAIALAFALVTVLRRRLRPLRTHRGETL